MLANHPISILTVTCSGQRDFQVIKAGFSKERHRFELAHPPPAFARQIRSSVLYCDDVM